MDILENISSELQNIDDENIRKPLITSVLLKLEDHTKQLTQQNRPAPFIKVSANLKNLFEGFLLDTLVPTSSGFDLINKSISLLMHLRKDFEEEKEKELLNIASNINRLMDLLISGKEITEQLSSCLAFANQVEQIPDNSKPVSPVDLNSDEKEPLEAPSIEMEDTPVEYVPPLNSEEDSIIYVEFVKETTDHIEHIENKILDLENSPDDIDLINDIFRPFHSIKGGAGFLGLSDINKLTHETENLLDMARKNQIKVNKNVIDVLLESVDVTKRLVLLTMSKIDKRLENLPEEEKIQSISISQTLSRLKEVTDQAITPDEKTTEVKKIIYKDEEKGYEAGTRLGEILIQKGDITPAEFEEAFGTQKKKIGEILVDKGAVSQEKVSDALIKQQVIGNKVTPPIKVDAGKLDILMELVGELVIAQTLVSQDEVFLNENNQRMIRNITNLGKITKSIQEQVMAIRMVPLKQTFIKMHRLIRDVSHKTNKKVELRITGENTEIDKAVVDELNDPLMHLLRNSIDHGIESPEERIRLGKCETGIVQLIAYHQGGNVVIEVIDDGKGLCRDNIYQKALKMNLIDKNKSFADHEVFNLIFLPGFSTVEVASDISGRGVGMDVVSSFIKNLGGKIETNSKKGKGTTFIIRLPMTMSIVDGMVVQVNKHRYIIPTTSILESIRPSKKAISTVNKKGELIKVRDKVYPLIRLHKLFGTTPLYNNPWDAMIVIIESNGKIKGLMVDDLLGQQQVVIKTLGKVFRPVKSISGGTILGDGQIGLILDTEELIHYS